MAACLALGASLGCQPDKVPGGLSEAHAAAFVTGHDLVVDGGVTAW